MKKSDVELALDYFEHLESTLEPEYLEKCKEKKLDPSSLDSAMAVRTIWSDYILACKDMKAAGPVTRCMEYLIKSEREDFLEGEANLGAGITALDEINIRLKSNHVFIIAIRALGNTLFDHGFKKLVGPLKFDMEKILRELKPKLEKEKPEDSLLTVFVNDDDELIVNCDWDCGPTGTINVFTITVDSSGLSGIKPGRGFKSDDRDQSLYVEKCSRKIWHIITSMVSRQKTPR